MESVGPRHRHVRRSRGVRRSHDIREHRRLLLRRPARGGGGPEPGEAAGRWVVPGGASEIGETVDAAAVRESLEEARVDVRTLRVFDVRDFIQLEGTKVRWHYVLIDVLCEFIGGSPFPGADAENARFVPFRELGEYDVASAALEVLQAASAARIAAGGSIGP